MKNLFNNFYWMTNKERASARSNLLRTNRELDHYMWHHLCYIGLGICFELNHHLKETLKEKVR